MANTKEFGFCNLLSFVTCCPVMTCFFTVRILNSIVTHDVKVHHANNNDDDNRVTVRNSNVTND